MHDLDAIYSPEDFKKFSQILLEEMAQHLAAPARGLDWQDPETLVSLAKSYLDRGQAPEETLRALARGFLAASNPLHSPHYMGHQVPPPLPLAGAVNALAGLANQGAAVYEMGPFGIAIERAMAARLATYIPWAEGSFESIVTHGGSLANLTALLAARDRRYPDVWAHGPAGLQGRRPAILTSEDSHYSNVRPLGIAGLGANQVIKVPLDSRRRMDVTKLPALLERSKQAGLDVFFICASACSTSTGAFDPLAEIADFARGAGLWFHVDGAHGAPFLLSPKYRHLLRGIEQSDSITWDAHKMMFTPALCTFLFYRRAADSFAAFHQDAPYLADRADVYGVAPQYDSFHRTVECTKGSLALPLWATWAVYGEALFVQLVEQTVAATQEFHAILCATADFEAVHEPECNILCFRLKSAASDRQKQIRHQIVRRGQFYITGTVLNGEYVLRVTVINPRTMARDFCALLDEIRSIDQSL
jgi:L-2,4-diaminobutyrate decarboxylase